MFIIHTMRGSIEDVELGPRHNWDDEFEQVHTHSGHRRLKAPTLIIWGFNDPSAPVILASHLLNVIAPVVSRTQLHIFNEATHSVYRDHPEEASSLVVNFIKNSP